MKKYIVCAALILVFFAVPIRADYLETMAIGILQETGSVANYDHSSQTITWSSGQDGWLTTEDYSGFVYFSELPGFNSNFVAATATFTGMTDNSSGTQAKASFSSGDWSITLNATGWGDVLQLGGDILGNYNETELDNSNKLNGRAVVVIDTAIFNNDYWATTDVGAISMTDTLVGMIVDISLPSSPAFDSYAQDYASNNVTVTIYADESIVPEPATMTLLALGGLLLRKRS